MALISSLNQYLSSTALCLTGKPRRDPSEAVITKAGLWGPRRLASSSPQGAERTETHPGERTTEFGPWGLGASSDSPGSSLKAWGVRGGAEGTPHLQKHPPVGMFLSPR